jgi:hypothetical protein
VGLTQLVLEGDPEGLERALGVAVPVVIEAADLAATVHVRDEVLALDEPVTHRVTGDRAVVARLGAPAPALLIGALGLGDWSDHAVLGDVDRQLVVAGVAAGVGAVGRRGTGLRLAAVVGLAAVSLDGPRLELAVRAAALDDRLERPDLAVLGLVGAVADRGIFEQDLVVVRDPCLARFSMHERLVARSIRSGLVWVAPG